MDPQQILEHLGRIGDFCCALARHEAWSDERCQAAFDLLAAHDQEFWAFTRYLSLPLYEETMSLLREPGLNLRTPPDIAVVMAVHEPDPELLRLSVRSALAQVGVRVHLHLSLDGPEGNAERVHRTLDELGADPSRVHVHGHPENRGVALCRNAALAKMQEEWFTFLDCDDIFHPLRLLHAWLAMHSLNVVWLSTTCSRVSIEQKKIVLLQQSLSASGMNSFLAHRQVLARYGYLAPLRFWEDSEYQLRLAHFEAPMISCSAVGHYANTRLDDTGSSLGRRWRQEAHVIEGHPWLCGTVLGEIDDETQAIRAHYQALHARLAPEQLSEIFTPEGTEMGKVAIEKS